MKRAPMPPRSTPIRKVNPEAKAKRVAKQKRHYASAEYKAARKAQMVVAGGQCEAWHLYGEDLSWVGIQIPGEKVQSYRVIDRLRCQETTALQFHELEYGSDLGLQRPITGVMLCQSDHQYIEMTRHPTRHPR
jgi:hypothetical protein